MDRVASSHRMIRLRSRLDALPAVKFCWLIVLGALLNLCLAQFCQAQQNPQPPLPSPQAGNHESFRGNAAAQVAIIEFADFQCPYCGKFKSDTYPQITRDYILTGKVRFFFRDLPLPMHARAVPAARAARCAGEQGKFWEMHDSLFAKQSSLTDKSFADRAQVLGLDATKFQECFSSTRHLDDILNSAAEAQKLGIEGTPTFILGTIAPGGDAVKIVNGIRGAQPYEAFKTALDELLAQIERAK